MLEQNDRLTSPVLDAALHWRDQCLVQDQAMFSQDLLWKMENLRALWVILKDSPGISAEHFVRSLEEKFGDAPAEVPRLCAELLWVLLLSPTPAHMGARRKVELIRTVYEWSGSKLSNSHPMLKEPLVQGIANPGMSFSSMRCEELMFLIKAVVGIKKKVSAKRQLLLEQAWKTGRVFDDAAGSNVPQMSHMLRHLLFPLEFEPIFNRRSKRRITESFSGIPRRETKSWSVTQLDEEMYRAREQLQSLYETTDLSFYREPLLSTWQGGGVSAPLSERRYWVEICDLANRPDRQTGDHALGKALWSPRRDGNGNDIGAIVREVEAGDVVFHFTDGEGITGVSEVTGELDEDFSCPEGTQWDGQPGYCIELQAFTQVVPPLPSAAYLSERRFQDDLRQLAESHQALFFNRQLTLNQGTHLSEAPEVLVRIFDEAFFGLNKQHLPHVVLPDPEDVPEQDRRERQGL